MQKFKNLHLWMIIPLLLIQLGIFRFYWPKFTTTPWEFHIHFWLVTAWLILMIFQPYLITIKKVEQHRMIGMLGLIIAGGIIFTSISLLDVPLKRIANGAPGPPPPFFYGTLVIEFFLAWLYAFSVVQAIRFRKNLNEHAWWMICSVFFLMMPAIGRGMIIFWRNILPPEKLNPMLISISAEIIFIPVVLIYAIRFGKVKHLATILVLLTVILRMLRVPIGSSEIVQGILETMIKWN
ncbi:hypothetical protein [Ekhidna sp.]|uniref:hypothetical protein n=1 Tax=Ekhidna sp. TaxID=2608089 RepID=UPI0035121F27